MTNTQSGCTYCTPDKDGYFCSLPTPPHAKNMSIQNSTDWRIDGGYVKTIHGLLAIRLDINFCPMCGRKLRENKHMVK